MIDSISFNFISRKMSIDKIENFDIFLKKDKKLLLVTLLWNILLTDLDNIQNVYLHIGGEKEPVILHAVDENGLVGVSSAGDQEPVLQEETHVRHSAFVEPLYDPHVLKRVRVPDVYHWVIVFFAGGHYGATFTHCHTHYFFVML
jgi:hypothetical protein